MIMTGVYTKKNLELKTTLKVRILQGVLFRSKFNSILDFKTELPTSENCVKIKRLKTRITKHCNDTLMM